MFPIKKLITYFVLLPPGNVILFLLLLTLFLAWKKHKRFWKITLIFAVFLYLFSIQPVASLLIKPLESRYKVPPKEIRNSCQALVVLGGGIKKGVPFLDTKDDLMEDSFKRVMAAYKLYTEKKRPIIVSGYSVSDKMSEAKVAKEILTYFGVDPRFVMEEGKSRDTKENALFTKKILERLKVQRFCLITSAYHMPRSVMLFEKAGFKRENIIPVPVDFKASNAPFTFYQLLPNSYWLNVSSKALKEYFGIIYYLLKG